MEQGTTVIKKEPVDPVFKVPLAPDLVKKRAVDKLMKIANLLLTTERDFGYNMMELCYGNTVAELTTDSALDKSYEAALSYSKEKRAGVKVHSAWITYARAAIDKFESYRQIDDLPTREVPPLACSLGIFPYTARVHQDYLVIAGYDGVKAQIKCAIASILLPPLYRPLKLRVTEATSQYYDMKKTQIMDDLQVINPPLSEMECPLLAKYDIDRFLGSGSYGLVTSIRAKQPDPPIGKSRYALKIAFIDHPASINDSNYEEVRAHDLIMQGIKDLHTKDVLCNVVKLYDWVKCKTNIRSILKKIPKDKTAWYHKDPKFMTTAQVYEFSILELVDGDYFTYFDDHPDTAFKPSHMRSFLTQSLCTLAQLQIARRFTHFDIHLSNVMRKLLPNSMQDDVLHYRIMGKDFYVPVADSNMALVKIGDFGLSYAEYTIDRDPISRGIAAGYWVEDMDNIANHFNPRHDCNELACALLERLFRFVSMNTIRAPDIDLQLVALLYTMVNSNWKGAKNVKNYQNVTESIDLLYEIKQLGDVHNLTDGKKKILEDADEAATGLRSRVFYVEDEEPGLWILSLLENKFFDANRQLNPSKGRLIPMDVAEK